MSSFDEKLAKWSLEDLAELDTKVRKQMATERMLAKQSLEEMALMQASISRLMAVKLKKAEIDKTLVKMGYTELSQFRAQIRKHMAMQKGLKKLQDNVLPLSLRVVAEVQRLRDDNQKRADGERLHTKVHVPILPEGGVRQEQLDLVPDYATAIKALEKVLEVHIRFVQGVAGVKLEIDLIDDKTFDWMVASKLEQQVDGLLPPKH